MQQSTAKHASFTHWVTYARCGAREPHAVAVTAHQGGSVQMLAFSHAMSPGMACNGTVEEETLARQVGDRPQDLEMRLSEHIERPAVPHGGGSEVVASLDKR